MKWKKKKQRPFHFHVEKYQFSNGRRASPSILAGLRPFN